MNLILFSSHNYADFLTYCIRIKNIIYIICNYISYILSLNPYLHTCFCFLFYIYIANGIETISHLSDLLRECNFRDLEKLIPILADRLRLRSKYDDYVSFVYSFPFKIFIILK